MFIRESGGEGLNVSGGLQSWAGYLGRDRGCGETGQGKKSLVSIFVTREATRVPSLL